MLEDNPTLDRAVIERYHRIYTGTFYERFVLGKWTAAEGLVYPMFDEEKNVFEGDIQCERYVISCKSFKLRALGREWRSMVQAQGVLL